ncbi:MAG: BadF/BadG/BcrA/BcrD ATPase family protein [Paracoccaceae bacterium]
MFFGVDGGGSGCRVAVCDSNGNRIGEVSGGPANVTSDRNQAIANVREAIARCAQDCGISDAALKSGIAHLGLAGAISKADEDAVAAAMPFSTVVVTDDCKTALVGALSDGYGVLAAIGTGTIVAARDASGTRTFGGWGAQISDQASGAWLGQEAYRRCVLAHDGLIAHSDLTRQILSQHEDDLAMMVAFARKATPQDYAKAARAIVEFAVAGDTNARHLMREGAAYLNSCFDAAQLEKDSVMCLSGGVGPHYKDYLAAHYAARVQKPLGTSLDGALTLAKQHLEALRSAQV